MTDFKLPVSEKEKAIIDKERLVVERLKLKKRGVIQRFPLLFTLLGSFGLVSIFYGFEHIIDQNQFLSENPIVLLAMGVGILAFTGTLYKKLG